MLGPGLAVIRYGLRSSTSLLQPQRHARSFQTTPLCLTNGTYPALNDMRVRTPWIEALRTQRASEKSSSTTTPLAPPSPGDAKPKRMSDSYHRVVGKLDGGR